MGDTQNTETSTKIGEWIAYGAMAIACAIGVVAASGLMFLAVGFARRALAWAVAV